MDATCNVCTKGPPEVSLKRCAKCSTTPYCSRECQKADWKRHKKICGKNQSTNAASSSSRPSNSGGSTRLSPPKGLDQPISKPFTRLDKGTWLHDRPEKDVYRLLVDAYRLRVEDTYTMDGELLEGSVYAGHPDGLEGFQDLLMEAEEIPGLLPPWWNDEKAVACQQFGIDDEWSDLRCAVEKSDIIEHYGDPQFPMQLRMLAEAIYQRGPGGSDGTEMRKMMVAMEAGELGRGTYGSIVDTTTMGLSDIFNAANH